jgi:hypothetical protein
MPGLKGLQAAQRLRSADLRAKVVFLQYAKMRILLQLPFLLARPVTLRRRMLTLIRCRLSVMLSKGEYTFVAPVAQERQATMTDGGGGGCNELRSHSPLRQIDLESNVLMKPY